MGENANEIDIDLAVREGLGVDNDVGVFVHLDDSCEVPILLFSLMPRSNLLFWHPGLCEKLVEEVIGPNNNLPLFFMTTCWHIV